MKLAAIALAALLSIAAVMGASDHTLATVTPSCKEMWAKMKAAHWANATCSANRETVLSTATTEAAICGDTKTGSAVSKCMAISGVSAILSSCFGIFLDLGILCYIPWNWQLGMWSMWLCSWCLDKVDSRAIFE